jgi:hypothetical protein
VDALFDYFTGVLSQPAESVRQTLLADYLASGARSNPACLEGLLKDRGDPVPGERALARRQERHERQEEKANMIEGRAP